MHHQRANLNNSALVFVVNGIYVILHYFTYL